MIAEIQAGIATTKTAFDVAKSIIGISDATKINMAVIELQQHILSAQQALLTALNTIDALTKEKRELEERIVQRTQWEDRRKQYQPIQPRAGLTVFYFQPPDDSPSPPHWACPNCFANEKISILQKLSPSLRTFKCTACPFEMVPDADISLPRVAPMRVGTPRGF